MAIASRVLITGADGFIGQHLTEALAASKCTVIGVGSPRSTGTGSLPVDLTDRDAVLALLAEHRPTHLIHLAGNKNLGYCEKNPEEVRPINLYSTQYLSEGIRQNGGNCRLVFLSSDYVFDGERGNYREVDAPAPRTVYGQMKFESEQLIQKECERYTIIRTGGVYGTGGKFFDWIVNNLKSGAPVEAFTDTSFTPTYVGDLARVICRLLERDSNDLLHVSGPEPITRYDMARAVARLMGCDETQIQAASVKATGLLIPADNSLNSEWTRKELNESFTGVADGIKLVIKE